ncbi:MAG: Competence protein A [Firmicutes bacterium ADurb.Bin373]|nr:pilus assembly protein PilM [Bacillota bacterium]OQA10906.1 MAG: Competence protein A [Firmicutes bacterium ADurb.Bin373]
MERINIKRYLKNFLPEKKYFTGVDIGAGHIKVAEIEVNDGIPEVVALRMAPSPPGVWGDNLDEEALIQALKEVLNPNHREVITCIGSEKAVCRIVQLPQMSEKDLWSAVKIEIQKYVPVPVSQLVIRYVKLGKAEEGAEHKLTGEPKTAGGQDLQDVLILAAPLTIVYQYHGIFSRSGYTVTAVDLQAFALWRVFGRNAPGGAALVDIGAKTSHFVLMQDGLIRFIRLLPAGSGDMAGISIELQRSLDYYAAHEKISVEKLLLSGQISHPEQLNEHLRRQGLGIHTEVGRPAVDFTGDELYDPAYAIPVGLALREVAACGRV